MELLKFNMHGQWTLLSKDRENGYESNQDNLSYRSLDHQGTLPVDNGTKGMLHGSPGSKRGPKKIGPNKLETKTPTPTSSNYADRNPGLAPTT